MLVVPTLHVVLGAAQCLCGQRRGGPRVLDGGRRIGLGGLLRGLQVPLGLRQAGACLGAHDAPARPDEVGRGGDLRLCCIQVLLESAPHLLGLLLGRARPGTQFVEPRIGLDDPRETAQRVGVLLGPSVFEGILHGLHGIDEFGTARIDELLRVGDTLFGVLHRGGKRRDRAPDVLGRVVERVEQRRGMPQSAFGLADRTHGVALLTDRSRHCGATLIDRILRERDLLLRQ